MSVCSTTSCGTGGWNGPLPGDPDNNSVLRAEAGYGGIQLYWTMPNTNVHAVAHTRIFRSIGDQFSTAIPLVTAAGNTYFDTSAAEPIRQYYYWIQHVSINGTVLDPIGPAWATARPYLDQVLQDLAEKVEDGMLAQSLRSRINKIQDLEAGLTLLNNLVIDESSVTSQELMALRGDVTDAMVYINEERQLRLTDQQALVSSVNTLVAQLNSDLSAAIQQELSVIADITGELLGQYTLKIDLAGNVSGFGLAASVDPNGNSFSEFGVQANSFFIAPPSIVQATAPANPFHGKVWVDTSGGGSVTKWYNKFSQTWQTTPVKGAVPFIVKTQPEVMPDGYTVEPGVYMDSAFIGRLNANQIDTRGLTVRDAQGNIILGSGTGLDWSNIAGSNKPQDGATRNVFRGNWAVSTAYAVGDIVLESGYGWSSKTNHVSSAEIRPPGWPTTSNANWTIYAIKGDPGQPGANGTRTAILDMYRNSAAAPTTFPSGTSTYTWATGQFTAPATTNGWSITPPAPVSGQDLWVTRQLYSDNLTSTTSSVTWTTTVARISAASGEPGEPGVNGMRTGYLEVYQWAFAAPTQFPSGSSTYTWATGAFTAPSTSNGWSVTPGGFTAGQTLWACSVTIANNSTGPTDTVNWNTTVAYAIGGAGTNGSNAKLAFLAASSQTFLIAKNGTATPSAITLTAYGQNVTGSPVFSVTSGTATLTGTGTSRSLALTGMTTDSATIRVVWDSQEDFVTVSKVREGVDGTNGLTITVTNEAHTLPSSKDGVVATGGYAGSGTQLQVYEGSVLLTPSATGTSGAFRIGTVTQTPASTLTVGGISYSSTTKLATIGNHSGMVAGTDSVVLNIPITIYRADGTSVVVNKTQTITKSKTGADGQIGPAGASPIAVVLSNEVHTFPASSTGAVTSYSGSGTQIRVYEGTTELDYDGSGTANGKWKVTTTASNITRGVLTDSGTYLTVGNHSSVAAGTDTSSITYTVSGRSSLGIPFTLTKDQTFSKARAGANAPLLSLTSTAQVFTFDGSGVASPSTQTISFTAGLQNLSGTATFTAIPYNSAGTAGSAITMGGSGNTRTLTHTQFGSWASVAVTATLDGLSDSTTVVRVQSGADGATGAVGESGLTAVVSNEAHTLPASSDGVVSSYAGSGTTIQVYEGSVPLTAVATIGANGQFTIGTPALAPAAITVGARSYATSTATVANHSSMSNGVDSVTITYPISVRRANGTNVSFSRTQTITKSKAGETGAQGPAVNLVTNRPATFTSTDGTLDSGQSNLVFTATTQGLTNPTFVWTFEGLTTNPTASTTSNQSITATQFGTSNSAIVTVTVNGTIVDKMTIVRLEKNTADPYSTTDSNLIYDPSFDKHVAGKTGYWVSLSGAGRAEIATAYGETASGAGLQIWGTGVDNNAYTSNNARFPARNGDVYYIYVRIWVDAAFNGNASLMLQQYNAAGSYIAQRSLTIASASSLKGAWHDVRGTISLTAADTSSIRARLLVGLAATAGFIRIDTVYVGRGELGSTKNSVWRQTTDPVLTATNIVTAGDIWLDTGVTPNVERMRVGTAWQVASTVGATFATGNAGTVVGQITSATASTYIANAAIGSAQIGSIALVGTSNFSVKSGTSGQRMEMDSRVIKIFDSSGVLRVQLGDLTL